jgi:hypothetical protein
VDFVVSLLHCNSCHHEWEGIQYSLCDWCGSTSYVLVFECPEYNFVLQEQIAKIRNEWKKGHSER